MLKLLKAYWTLLDEGLFNYLILGGFFSYEVYIIIIKEIPGVYRKNLIILPNTQVIASIKLRGWGRILGQHCIFEREYAF